MKRYKITLPTPERCTELGIKFEGLAIRTQMWLVGVCHGVAFTKTANLRATDNIRFNLFLTTKQACSVETNSRSMIEQVSDHLHQYGCTVTPIAPEPPPARAWLSTSSRLGVTGEWDEMPH